MHERVRPFNKFLHWELDNFPLDGEFWTAEELLELALRSAVAGCRRMAETRQQGAIDRHLSQVRRDLARLTAIGVLEQIEAPGAAQPMRRRTTRLARSVVSLPRLIESEIGFYTRARPAVAGGKS